MVLRILFYQQRSAFPGSGIAAIAASAKANIEDIKKQSDDPDHWS